MRSRGSALALLLVVYLGFISLGLPDGTLGVAWPAIYPELHVPIGAAGAIMIVATLLSGLSGILSARIIARFRTGPVVMVSCLLTGSALLLVSRAASLPWLMAAALPLGIGAGAVDAGLNGFVARHYSGRHMNWLHACWGIGATSGPLFMGYALGTAAGWRLGYVALGGTQVMLAVLFLLTLRLWAVVPERVPEAGPGEASRRPPTLGANSTAGWLSPAIFALYVAIETTVGLWAGSIMMVGRGIAPATAALGVAAYYGSITGGRILVGFVVNQSRNRGFVTLGLGVALVGALFFAVGRTPNANVAALVLLGLGFAPVYPCLMHEVPRRFLAEAVQTVIGRQSGASYLGGALLPAAAGWLAQVSLGSLPWVVVAGTLGLWVCARRLDQIS